MEGRIVGFEVGHFLYMSIRSCPACKAVIVAAHLISADTIQHMGCDRKLAMEGAWKAYRRKSPTLLLARYGCCETEYAPRRKNNSNDMHGRMQGRFRLSWYIKQAGDSRR